MKGTRVRVLLGTLLGFVLLMGLAAGPAMATGGQTAYCAKSGCHSRNTTTPKLVVTTVASTHRLKVVSGGRYTAIYQVTSTGGSPVLKKKTTSKSFTFQGVRGRYYQVVTVSVARSAHRLARPVRMP